MGVMSCSKRGCDNIMCDTYVLNVGYVCYECREDFKKHLTLNRIPIYSDHDIVIELQKYIEIEKPYGDQEIHLENVDKFFQNHTR